MEVMVIVRQLWRSKCNGPGGGYNEDNDDCLNGEVLVVVVVYSCNDVDGDIVHLILLDVYNSKIL